MVEVSEILTCGIMLFLGFVISMLLKKIHVPGMLGMMILGIFIGPEFGNLIADGILNISSELRSMALIIILAQSGLHLDIESLKKVGRPAILLSILPATFEIVGCMVGCKLLLDFTYAEGLTLGAVLGSVSPAIIAARMIELIEKRLGENHRIPQLILAGAGCDDIYTIILFYAFLNIVGSSNFDWKTILGIPISIVTGIILGVITGVLSVIYFKNTNFDIACNILVIFSVSMLLQGLESLIDDAKEGKSWEFVSVSGLLGVIVNGIIILYKLPEKAKEFSHAFSAIWRFFEIILFTLVGATIEFDEDFKNNLGKGILVLLIGLAFRSVGTYISMIGTELTFKEKVYITVTFISKATVQASIGGIALSRGYECGKTILNISAISIILTAPFGSAWMECMAPVLLDKGGEGGEGPAIEVPIAGGPTDTEKEELDTEKNIELPGINGEKQISNKEDNTNEDEAKKLEFATPAEERKQETNTEAVINLKPLDSEEEPKKESEKEKEKEDISAYKNASVLISSEAASPAILKREGEKPINEKDDNKNLDI
ncbi:MAG: cation:proton antiporter [archaeon]|nr:cation:proton antiporter [archaeon]